MLVIIEALAVGIGAASRRCSEMEAWMPAGRVHTSHLVGDVRSICAGRRGLFEVMGSLVGP